VEVCGQLTEHIVELSGCHGVTKCCEYRVYGHFGHVWIGAGAFGGPFDEFLEAECLGVLVGANQRGLQRGGQLGCEILCLTAGDAFRERGQRGAGQPRRVILRQFGVLCHAGNELFIFHGTPFPMWTDNHRGRFTAAIPPAGELNPQCKIDLGGEVGAQAPSAARRSNEVSALSVYAGALRLNHCAATSTHSLVSAEET